MKRILTLLEQKNHYLEKFTSLNEDEIGRFMENNFENLEEFYNTRENILEIIRYIDNQINVQQADVNMDKVSVSDKEAMKALLKTKDIYVSQIIQQDLEVLACIDHAKSGIIRELQDLRKNRKAIDGYKAPQFGKRLDEEA